LFLIVVVFGFSLDLGLQLLFLGLFFSLPPLLTFFLICIELGLQLFFEFVFLFSFFLLRLRFSFLFFSLELFFALLCLFPVLRLHMHRAEADGCHYYTQDQYQLFHLFGSFDMITPAFHKGYARHSSENFVNHQKSAPMKLFCSVVFILAPLLSFGEDQPILVTPKWLNDHKQDPKLVILQVSFLQFDYDREHLPGSQYLWPGWLAPDSPHGAYNMPTAKAATDLLQGYGINNDSYVVICHIRGEVSAAARMFLTLENMGLKGKVSFLNGGLEAWKKEGYPVTKEVPVAKKGNISIKAGNLLVDKDYVLKTLNSDQGVIVDARTKNFYDGAQTGNPRDGHIKGALNIPYPDMIDQKTYVFKPVDSLSNYFVPVVPDKKKEVVTYCFIGQTASVVYMTGRILGYDVKLYDGSMQEWSRIDELPMETTQLKKP
jgi:thiosulfate/3-mercaptopyruvate sulfurtransferase